MAKKQGLRDVVTHVAEALQAAARNVAEGQPDRREVVEDVWQGGGGQGVQLGSCAGLG